MELKEKNNGSCVLEWEDLNCETNKFEFHCSSCWSDFVDQFLDFLFSENTFHIPTGANEEIQLNDIKIGDWIRFKHPNIGNIWGEVSGIELRKQDNSIASVKVCIYYGKDENFHWIIINFSDIIKCIRSIK